MSMTRTDALTQLARGLRKFDGMTAGQVLATEWPGLKALPVADLEYFEKHAGKPIDVVAQACHGRSMARTDDPLDMSQDDSSADYDYFGQLTRNEVRALGDSPEQIAEAMINWERENGTTWTAPDAAEKSRLIAEIERFISQ